MQNNDLPVNTNFINSFMGASQEELNTDLHAKKRLEVSYRVKNESKTWRTFKSAVAVIIFPIGVCKLVHGIAGLIIVPSSAKTKKKLKKLRANLVHPDSPDYKYKRLTIEVDGVKVDVIVSGLQQNLNNGRWLICAPRNAETSEEMNQNREVNLVALAADANVLTFNYPAVGGSSGVLPSRKAMEKAFSAMVTFLEDDVNGVGAKELILYGRSIGGGVISDVLKKYKFKEGVTQVAVFDRSFSSLSKGARKQVSIIGSLAVKILRWNMEPAKVLHQHKHNVVIIQTKNKDPDRKDKSDGVISEKSYLANEYIKGKAPEEIEQILNQDVYLVDKEHVEALEEDHFREIARRIEDALVVPPAA